MKEVWELSEPTVHGRERWETVQRRRLQGPGPSRGQEEQGLWRGA